MKSLHIELPPTLRRSNKVQSVAKAIIQALNNTI